MKCLVERYGDQVAVLIYEPGDEEEDPLFALFTGGTDEPEDLDELLSTIDEDLSDHDDHEDLKEWTGRLKEYTRELKKFRRVNERSQVPRENPTGIETTLVNGDEPDLTRLSETQLRDMNRTIQNLLRDISAKSQGR